MCKVLVFFNAREGGRVCKKETKKKKKLPPKVPPKYALYLKTHRFELRCLMSFLETFMVSITIEPIN